MRLRSTIPTLSRSPNCRNRETNYIYRNQLGGVPSVSTGDDESADMRGIPTSVHSGPISEDLLYSIVNFSLSGVYLLSCEKSPTK